jgi:hypothetical protein
MNLREGDEVSAVALVVETEADAAAAVDDDGAPAGGDVDGVVAAEPELEADASEVTEPPEEEPAE